MGIVFLFKSEKFKREARVAFGIVIADVPSEEALKTWVFPRVRNVLIVLLKRRDIVSPVRFPGIWNPS